MLTKENEYLHYIDGLRALSIILVVAFHYYPALLTGGFVGVDVFFVISGFLITRIILKQQKYSDFVLLDFYKKRFKRLIPSLLFVLAATMVAGYFVLLSSEYLALSKYVISSLFYFTNILVSSEVSYFDVISLKKPLLHLWSLSLEEQFYLFWPLLLFLITKINPKVTLGISILMVLSFLINIDLSTFTESQAYYMIQSRAWQLLAGAFVSVHQNKMPHLIKSSLSYASVVALVLSAFLISKSYKYPSYISLIPTCAAALLIFNKTENYLYSVFLKQRALVYIGLISYPLYLIHWPVLSLARILEINEPGPVYKAVLFSITIFLTVICYELVEKKARKRPARNIFAFSLIILVASIFVITEHGLPSRNPDLEQKLLGYTWAQAKNSDAACVEKYGNEFNQYCKQKDLDNNPEILLVGDSNANHLYTGLGMTGNVLNLGKGACLPFFNIESTLDGEQLNCSRTMNSALNLALKTKEIKTVVLSFAGAGYLNLQKNKACNESSLVVAYFPVSGIQTAKNSTPR